MRRQQFIGAALAVVLAALPVALSAAPATPEVPAQIVTAAKSLKPQQGRITLGAIHASLDLGTAYDFYGPADARKILVEIWGNPPQNAEGVLGIVMPAGKSPLTDAWGAVITFEETGYVSDEDAAEVDYDELMTQMQESGKELNAARKSEGYPEIKINGWAMRPNYDQGTHSVVWARELTFADSPVHTLNYDVRTLGRKGVLSVNLVSSMPNLDETKAAARTFAARAQFDPGARYEDYDASVDRKAEYGIGGLVAAGVGVAAAKKLGLFAILLKFLKPILIGAAVMLGALRNRIAGLFGRAKDPLEGE